jgi:hypothetical protein
VYTARAKHLRVLLDEFNTLLDVLRKVGNTGIEELLLVFGDFANGVDLLDTVGAELDVGAEVFAALVLVEG